MLQPTKRPAVMRLQLKQHLHFFGIQVDKTKPVNCWMSALSQEKLYEMNTFTDCHYMEKG